MKPIQHPSNNDVLGAPKGMSAEECSSLFITRVKYAPPSLSIPAVNAVISFWQPSLAQLELLNAGKPIFISVLGTTHPSLSIGVDGDGQLGF
jgi:hypothetical protein